MDVINKIADVFMRKKCWMSSWKTKNIFMYVQFAKPSFVCIDFFAFIIDTIKYFVYVLFNDNYGNL